MTEYKIYRLISPSGKSYIGYTKNEVKTRFKQHCGSHKRWLKDKKRIKSSKLLYAFQKYPYDQWVIETLYTTDSFDDAQLKEDEYIKEYNSIVEGYNKIPGGFGGKGKKLSEEHKRKQSEARKAFYLTEQGKEDKEAKSDFFKKNNPSKKGKKAWNEGLSHSEESKSKISESLKQFYDNRSDDEKLIASERTKELWTKGVFDNRPPRTEEQKLSQSKRMKAENRKQTEYQKQKVSEAKRKTWVVTDDKGNEELVENLTEWCVNKGFNPGVKSNMTRYGYRGYKAVLSINNK